jgi:hypothetical protein
MGRLKASPQAETITTIITSPLLFLSTVFLLNHRTVKVGSFRLFHFSSSIIQRIDVHAMIKPACRESQRAVVTVSLNACSRSPAQNPSADRAMAGSMNISVIATPSPK